MAAITDSHFHWADYLVFCLSLCISLGIGIFYAIKDRHRKNNEDFLLAGRNMKLLPMMASTFATIVPPVGYIAFPVEVYYFGFGYIFNGIGACLGAIPIALLIAPTFHRMKLFSAFEYLEFRFNPSIRKMASILQTIMQLLIMGMFTYAPAVALAQVSGISIWLGIGITTAVCTTYTTFGGMRAVIWSDAIQVFLMFIGIGVLTFKAIADLGGFQTAFQIIHDGGRINQFNLSLNPFIRSGVWSYFIGSFFACFVPLSSSQIAIQRYVTLPTVSQLKKAILLLIPMYFMLTIFFLLTGLAMYGHFADCDPISSGQIQSVDQMVPLLVMKVLGPWPGLPGLFIACLFAASLSTVSSGQNALAAMILKDLIEPSYLKYNGHALSQKKSFFIAKAIVFIAGLIIMLMACLVVVMGGDLFMLLGKFMGIFVGPIGGLFTIAILIKELKDIRAVMTGFIVSSVIGTTIAIGSEIYQFIPRMLPIASNCTLPDMNITLQSTASYSPLSRKIVVGPQHSSFLQIFNLNPLYYTVLCYSLTVLLAVTVDQCIKCRNRQISSHHVHAEHTDAVESSMVPKHNQNGERSLGTVYAEKEPEALMLKDIQGDNK